MQTLPAVVGVPECRLSANYARTIKAARLQTTPLLTFDVPAMVRHEVAALLVGNPDIVLR